MLPMMIVRLSCALFQSIYYQLYADARKRLLPAQCRWAGHQIIGHEGSLPPPLTAYESPPPPNSRYQLRRLGAGRPAGEVIPHHHLTSAQAGAYSHAARIGMPPSPALAYCCGRVSARCFCRALRRADDADDDYYGAS